MLPRRTKRAYIEARYRQYHGASSPHWRGSEFEVEVWMNAFVLSEDNPDISPWDALLEGVKRRRARIFACDQVVNAIMDKHRAACLETGEGDPDVPTQEARVWMAESRNEERIAMRTAKMAIDAGVAEAMIRRFDMEGRLVTDALLAGLDVLELSPDDRIRALERMHSTLLGDQLKPPNGAEPRAIDPPDDDT